MSPEDLMTLDQLAALLQRPRDSLRNDRSRNPAALPPAIKLPGTRCLRWRRADVSQWLASLPHQTPQRGAK